MICLLCGKEFKKCSNVQKYCSFYCARKDYRNKRGFRKIDTRFIKISL